jgi:ureidoglycolate lyase
MSNTLKITPLTRESFAPFGDVLQVSDDNQQLAINYGLTQRHHQLATTEVGAEGEAIISIFRSTPVSLPFEARIMERHPLGSQAFMPLSGNSYLVVVAPAGDFDNSRMKAFIAAPNQGVNYHRGTWHHYCLTLDTVSDFLVVDRKGPGNNCDEVELDTPVRLTREEQ